jgi:exonuclease SbcD
MHSFRFVHAADLHLDSPLRGLEFHEDAPIELIRTATREALRNLVDLCIQESVSFLIIAGDVYDGDWKSVETGRFFARQMNRLAAAEPPISVFLVKGNHDAQSVVSRELPVPSVQTFSHRKPETATLSELGVAIHGQSYSRPDLTDDISREYPAAVKGQFNIGILHTCASGRNGHDRYAPCDPIALAQKGYQYWALGHVHKREIISTEPYIVFPGNVQGRHVHERALEGKGCTIVSVDSGEVVELKHVVLDVVRWDLLEIDIFGCGTILEVLQRVAGELSERAKSVGDRLLAARVRIVGVSPASPEIYQNLSSFVGAVRERAASLPDDVWLEDVSVQCRAPTLDDSLENGASLVGLVTSIRSYAIDHAATLHRECVAPLAERFRASHPELVHSLGLDSVEIVSELLPEVEQALGSMIGASSVQ